MPHAHLLQTIPRTLRMTEYLKLYQSSLSICLVGFKTSSRSIQADFLYRGWQVQAANFLPSRLHFALCFHEDGQLGETCKHKPRGYMFHSPLLEDCSRMS